MGSRRRDLHGLVDEISGVYPDITASAASAILVLPHTADPISVSRSFAPFPRTWSD